MVDYENLPEGYIKRRKVKGIMLAISVYATLIYIIISMNIDMKFSTGRCIFGVFCIVNVIFVCMCDAAKITYKGMPIPNYGEIKVFTLKEQLVLILPVILGIAIVFYINMLAIWYVMISAGCIGAAYVGVRIFSRPMDSFDRTAGDRYERYR